MKRILLDENIDRSLKVSFASEFEVVTVRERGWSGKKNGELLQLAQKEFDIFVTMDNNLEYQQNLKAFDLGFVVIQATSNAYLVVAPLMSKINEVSKIIQAGELIRVKS